jgi:hypothetical protein
MRQPRRCQVHHADLASRRPHQHPVQRLTWNPTGRYAQRRQ